MTLQQPVESLLPDVPRPKCRYKVVLTLTRSADGCEPAQELVLAELAAAAVSAEGLLTAWAAELSVLSMVLDAEDDGEALAAGVAVVRALGGTRGATVTAERYEGREPIGLCRALAHCFRRFRCLILPCRPAAGPLTVTARSSFR